MPTLIGHAVTGIALSSTISHKKQWLRVGILSIICAIAPDIDSIGFRLGIPYHHWLGHRGFSHSIVFAAAFGLIASLFISKKSAKIWILSFCVFFASGLLHDVLDAMTNGGLGIAFFSPFSNERYFLPWQPIEVSPLSLRGFLTFRGMKVFISECIWVIMPSLCFLGLVTWYKKRKKRNKASGHSHCVNLTE